MISIINFIVENIYINIMYFILAEIIPKSWILIYVVYISIYVVYMSYKLQLIVSMLYTYQTVIINL